jgi:polyketide synthase PksN
MGRISNKTDRDVAIIGIHGRFPQSDTSRQLWENLYKGKSCIEEIPKDRWSETDVYNTDNLDKSFRMLGGFITDVDKFDPLLFKVSPNDASEMDPQQRLFLESVWSCLEDAGYGNHRQEPKNKIGLFVGSMWHEYSYYSHEFGYIQNRYGGPGSLTWAIANRTSFILNLYGPSIAIDTACSSSAMAVHLAYQSILNAECDMAVAGGINLNLHPTKFEYLAHENLLAADPDKYCFKPNSEGYLPGEGVGSLLLKPLKNAIADGDHIYAVIKGTATNHNGGGMFFRIPDSGAQARLLHDAYTKTGIDPRTISYIEMAAFGSELTDGAEFSGLCKGFGKFTRDKGFCALGTLKPNLGHLEAASGISQIIKVLLQMKYRKLLPARFYEPVPEELNIENSPFYLQRECTDWEPLKLKVAGKTRIIPRRAGINSFGAGGTNVHLILEEYISPESVKPANELMHETNRLFVFSANHRTSLNDYLKKIIDFIKEPDNKAGLSMSDMEYTLQVGREAMKVRAAFIASSPEELTSKIEDYLKTGGTRGEVFHEDAKPQGKAVLDKEWVRNASLEELAAQWLKGSSINWQHRYDTGERHRIPLPAYSFLRQSYWVNRKNELPQKPQTIERTINKTAKKGNQSEEQVVEYLKQLFSRELGISYDQINETEAVWNYGLDSLAIKRLNKELEHKFGKITATLLFEYKTIGELAAYLSAQYPELTKSSLKDDTIKEKALPDSSGSVPELMPDSLPLYPKTRSWQKSQDIEEPIAIIGISGRYPMADSVTELWKNLKSGRDCITEIPQERWDYKKWFHPDNPQMSYSKWGGFINNFDKFDPMFFNITPREAELMDPQERLLLQTVWEAIEDAGYTGRKLGGTSGSVAAPVGVFVGVMWSEYQLFGVEETLKGNFVTPSSAFWSIPNRVSYFFNYSGPSIAVDTACSSSLTAIHLACESLRRNECTAAIAGGISLSMHPSKYLYLSHRKFASSEGKCRTFGEGGDGYVPGEGVGAIILKPLSKAVSDGDHIYGVIRSSAISHGGKTNGYTVPSPRAQAEVIKTAMKKAGIDPRTIGYVEAHGTGTALGDPIEIEGLTQAFGNVTEEGQYCAIGSLKSNIGHCESAAGIAGVTKVLLQLKYGQLVPSLHSEVLNSNIDFTGTPFTVQQELAEWKCRKVEINGKLKEYPRRACVSSFGAGGANAHVIIEEYISNEGQRTSVTINTQNPAVIVLSAKTEEQLKELAQRMLTAIEEQQILDINLADMAYTLQTGREVMEERLAVIAASVAQLKEKLKGFVEGQDKIKDLYRGQVKRSTEIADFFSDDEELQEAVAKWVQRKKYGKLMELWVKGLAVDWSMLYGDTAPCRISLPTYPFAKERYWVPEVKTEALSSTVGAGTAAHIHPLIHENTSDFTVQRFSSSFTGREFFISRHTENGQKVLPGVAYLEMVRVAVEQSTGTLAEEKKVILLENVVTAQFVRLTDKPHKINIALYPKDVDRYLFEIYSTLQEDGTEDIIHAQGAVVLKTVSSIPLLDIEGMRSRCSKTVVTAGRFYENLSNMGLDVTTEYRGVQEVYCGEGEVLVRLSLPASVSGSGEEFVLHPVTMDSVMQASMWLLSTQDSSRPAEPFSLEHLSIYKNCSPEMWVSIRHASRGKGDESNNKLDITLSDNEGKVCISLNGLEFNYINQENTMFDDQSNITAEEQAETADGAAAEANTLASVKHLKKLISEITKIPENRLDSEAHFEELGLDSITITSLNQKVEQWVGKADATLFFKYKSIHDLGNYLAEMYPDRISGTVRKITASRPVQTSRPVIKRDIPKLVSLRPPEQIKRQTFLIGSDYPGNTDIAIIGVSGRFPGAETLEQFWKNLYEGIDCIDEIPRNRWAMEGFFEPDRSKAVAEGLSYSKWGGFLKDIDCFDPLFFNISPKEAMAMDPQERLFLETAWECVEDAGYTRKSLKEAEGGNHIGVFAGVSFNAYQLLISEAALKANRDMYPVNSQTFSVANRVSYVMNFTGPSLAVDTACSSSLYAIHLACEAIRSGQTKMAIAGGVNLSLHPSKYIMLSQGQFCASDGRCRAFNEGGTGYVSSEGVGAVFLKPLKDAEADGDIIYGVIKGTAANHGGKTNGFTVPNPVSQAMVIEQALLRSNIDPRSVSFIEAHGTGTALGDPIEITGLTDAFRKYTEDTGFCRISSVKSNIGHAEAAAGIAQLVKVLLQFKYRTLVKNVPHGNGLNPNIDFTKTPFVVQEKTEHWKRPIINGQEVPRRAGVSSFGAGGSNAHVVLEEYIVKSRKQTEVSVNPLIIVLSAKSGEQVREQAKRLLNYIVEKDFKDSDLASIAYTLQVGRETMEERLAAVVNSITELKSVLKDFAEGKENMPNLYRGQVRSNKETLAAFAADEDMEKTVQAWIVKGKYEKITDLWVKGMNFDWNRLYGETKPQRISLPTYPFLKERYWIPEFSEGGSGLNGDNNSRRQQFSGANVAGAFIHPLLHANTSDFSEQRFTSVFTGQEFFLKDHIVKKQKVLPGVAHLEMAREAVRQAVGNALESGLAIRLKDVAWIRPIVVMGSQLKVNISLLPEDNGEISYEIYTNEENCDTVIFSQGRAVVDRHTEVGSLDIDSIKNRCVEGTVSTDRCYDIFRSLGLDYGEGHRGIENVYTGKGCLLAKLCIPDCVGDTLDNFVLHPGLTDSALQASLILTADMDGNAALKPTLPFALEELIILDRCSAQMWAFVSYNAGSAADDRIKRVDIDLCDMQGKVCARFKGLSSRVLEGELGTGGESAGTLLAEPYWRKADNGNNRVEIEYEEHLVFLCEQDGISSNYIKDNIKNVRCISLECEEDSLDKRFESYALQVFNEVKDILVKKYRGKVLIQIVVPSYNENRILGGISGLLRTARLESSKLVCQSIWLDQALNQNEIIEILKHESINHEDVEIKYESGHRYVLGWRELSTPVEEEDIPWKDNGIYLVTGGAGGLGLIFAEDITKKTKDGTIILVGRSELDKEKEKRIKALGTRVLYRQVDVTDKIAVNGLIKEIVTDFGRLNGIIHSAGIIRDNFIIKKTETEFKEVLAPKTAGLVNLEQASRDIELDFFIIFSSTAGSFGNPGQADYTTANTFMDWYAAYYNMMLGEKGFKGRMLSLSWPLWKDGGMRVDARTEKILLENTGMMPMKTASGIKAMYKSLKQGGSRIAILEGKPDQIRRKLLGAADNTDVPLKPVSPINTETDLKLNTKEKLIKAISELLAVKVKDIDTAGSWDEYGIDQIKLARLADMLSERFNTDLTVSKLLEYNNSNKLLEFLTSGNVNTFEEIAASDEAKIDTSLNTGKILVSDEELFQKTVLYLKNEVASVIKLSADRIEAEAPMEKYGIDSVLSMQLVNQLEKTFGSLSKTLFFEYQNIRELAFYFVEAFKEKLTTLFDINENTAKGTVENEKPVVTDLNLNITGTNLRRNRFRPLANGIKEEKPKEGTLDIAIIGLSGRYPQAKDLDEFWENLKNGRDCITEIPKDRWDHSLYFDEDKNKQGKTYSKWGGFIEGVDRFDPLFFNISPREAETMDPQERLFLECVYSAIEDAGYTREMLNSYHGFSLGGNVGVFVGVMYEEHQLYGAQSTALGTPFALTGYAGSIANRVSYFFNFHGPSMAVDTLCSSSLTAINLACQSLIQGGCKLAVAGGVNVSIHPNKYLLLAQGKFASSKGRCESFGQGGDGYVPGEGVGAILLKPLSKAIEDKDNIYGVIKAATLNHGGKTNGYTVPNPNAQGDLIGQAYKDAGINPRTVSYIEAHGTGTSLGDPIEIAGLNRAFREYTDEKQFCAIGSVKSNIGHCESAAGIAAVTKVLLQMKYRQIVPSLHSKTLNPYIDFENSPFVVQQTLTEWKRPVVEIDGKVKEYPRIAGISSFGAGGANAHVIIEEYIEEKQESNPKSSILSDGYIIVLSARNGDRLKEKARQLLAFINAKQLNDEHLWDISYTLQIGREAMEERLAVLVKSVRELDEKLNCFLEGKNNIDNLFYGKSVSNNEALSLWKDDEDLQKTIDTWIHKGKYSKFISLWVKGLNFDWNKLYGGSRFKRMSLPTYPFARERYWMPDKLAKSISGGALQNSEPYFRIHPLLHQNTSNFSKQRFSSIFTGEEFFLRDHVVKNKRILPGVAFIEMAREAIVQAVEANSEDQTGIMIKDIVWTRPVVLTDRQVKVDISLYLKENGEIAFEICSGMADENTETSVFCQGSAVISGYSEAPFLDLNQLKDRCNEGNFSKDQCYEAFKIIGLDYGEGHRGIDNLYMGSDGVLAKLSLPDCVRDTFDRFFLHPSLADSALQASIGLYMRPYSNLEKETVLLSNPLLPYALNELRIFDRCSRDMWAYVRFSDDCSAGDKVDRLDIDLCDEQGKVCAQLRGLISRVEESDHGVGLNSDAIGTLMLEPCWNEMAVVQDYHENVYEEHLVLLCGQGEYYSQAIQDNIKNVRCVQLKCHEVDLDKRFEEYAVQVFREIKAILGRKHKEKVLIQVVIPLYDQPLLLEGISGMLKTVRLENSKLVCQLIQIDKAENPETIIEILEENGRSSSDICIRYEAGKRYVSGWKEIKVAEEVDVPWKDKGVYLITGGVGGLGLVFARDIAMKADKPVIILTGRSSLSEDKEIQIKGLEDLGAVISYRQTDVTDKTAVSELIGSICAHYGRLNGIIHSAGVIHDNFIIKKPESDFKKVLTPKTSGLVNLDHAVGNMELDFFILFSSIAGCFGNPGQVDYSTANAFMDSYAGYSNTQMAIIGKKRRMLSVNWPLWKEGGMHVDVETEKALFESTGIAAIQTEKGIQAMYKSLKYGKNQVVVIEGKIPEVRRNLLSQNRISAGKQENVQVKALPAVRDNEKTAVVPDNLLKDRTIEYLKNEVASVIGLSPERIEAGAPMDNYGIDSIMSMQLVNQLEKSFGSLSKTLFFEYQSINELSEYFVESYRKQLMAKFGTGEVDGDKAEQQERPQAPEMPLKIALNNSRFSRSLLSQMEMMEKKTSGKLDVAIIGLAGRYPKAKNIAEFWENLCNGRDCITEIPKERWDHSLYFDEDKDIPGKTYSKWGGFIEGVDRFDPLFFNITPREAELMDPQERLFLECVYSAIEDAGYNRELLNDRKGTGLGGNVGVFVGVMYEEYQLYGAMGTALGRPFALQGNPSSIANRVSYYFNFHGPSMAVDTMCSSSLTAIHLACRSLMYDGCEIAVAGGVNVSIHPNKYLLLAQGRFVSSKGRCESFGQGGDGYVPGEGVGAVILKPLSKALEDGDHIYAVIKGSALNHGGKTNGFTVPNPNAQAELIGQAFKVAGVNPRTISYIEAHGTGTSLGDPIEIAGLSKAFQEYTEEKQFCAIGSVKSNIGHCESAAGIAGLTKILLQMKYRKLVPSLHSETLNPYIDFKNSPFIVQQELAEWKQPVIEINGRMTQYPRIAGISSFGAGGSNAHIVIEEFIDKNPEEGMSGKTPDGRVIIILSARNGDRLKEKARQMLAFIREQKLTGADLVDLAYTLQGGREAMEERLGMIVESVEELENKLGRFLEGKINTDGIYYGQIKSNKEVLNIWKEDDDLREAVNTLISKRKFTRIVEIWVKGFNFDWNELYPGKKPRRLSLPTYPFAGERYWFSENVLQNRVTITPSQHGGNFDETLYSKLIDQVMSDDISTDAAAQDIKNMYLKKKGNTDIGRR